MRWESFERRAEKDDKDYEGETKENLDVREGEQRRGRRGVCLLRA